MDKIYFLIIDILLVPSGTILILFKIKLNINNLFFSEHLSVLYSSILEYMSKVFLNEYIDCI